MVEGLALPPEERLVSAELERYDAVNCLVQRAIQQRNDFTLCGQEEAVVRLCRLLGGSPLGIELATALLPTLSCAQVVAEVERDLDVLVNIRCSVPERHHSLRAVFDQSWRLLSVEEQQIFPRLSVFQSGFTLDAAQQVSSADLVILNQLVAKSLLKVAVGEEGAPPRYDIHEMLRQYAQEVLDGEPDLWQQVQAAHSVYYAGMVEQQGEWWLGDNRQEPAVLSSEIDNIRVTWQRAIQHRDMKAIAQMMHALSHFYEMRGWYQEMSDLFAPALESLQPPVTPEEQLVWGQLAVYHAWAEMYLGKLAEAHRLAQQAVDMLRQHGPGKPLAFALKTLGVMQLNEGDYAIAGEILQESLGLYRALGCRRECSSPLNNLGLAYIGTGDYESARKVLEEVLALYYQEGIPYGVAQSLDNLGFLHCSLGNLAVARHYFEQALSVCEDVEVPHLKGCVLIELSEVGARQGQFEQALTDCQTGMEILRQVNDLQTQAMGLMWQGLAHHGLGDEIAAYRCLGEGLEIALKINSIPIILALLIGGAVLLLDSSCYEKGIDLLMLAARHPATEQSYRVYARELLARQGITLPDDVVFQEDRPPAEAASVLLVDLKATVSASAIAGTPALSL